MMCLSAASNRENQMTDRWKFNLLFVEPAWCPSLDKMEKIPGLSVAVDPVDTLTSSLVVSVVELWSE